MLGSTELIIILAIIILIFGGAAIPKLAKSIGKARVEFEKGLKEGEKETKDSSDKEKK